MKGVGTLIEFIPKWIAWEVTEVCNLRCIHCRSSSDLKSSEGNFSTEEAKSLIDDIASYCNPVLVLTGGEPLLRKDLFEIAGYASMKGFRVCIATNGTLINDEICTGMKQNNVKMVSLSLDGPTKEVHDDFRNMHGAFDGAISGIKYLKKHRIPFLINSSFTKRNQNYIAETFRFAKSLGATAWYMFMIVPTGRGKELFEELISPEDYDEILKWHFDMELKENEILMRPTCAPHYYRIVPQLSKERSIKFKRRSLTFSTGGGKGCVAGQTICLIDCFGNIKPCSYFPLSAGNLKEKSFKEIWEKSPLMQDMRKFKEFKGRCGKCEFLNICGGCRARAYTMTGDYMEEEPFCDYVPIRLR